jgi:hypothetical protein
MAFTIVTQGQFTQGTVAQNMYINVPQGADYFRTQNITQLGLTPTPGVGVMFEWYNNVTPLAGAIEWSKTAASNAINASLITTGGFTYYTSYPIPGPAKVGTAITNANPAVVTIAAHGFTNGQKVILTNTTGMLQIAGMQFTVDNVTTNTFQLDGLNASGFATAATAVTARTIAPFMPVEPETLFITAISQANSAVVTTSIYHNYVVGMEVHFSVPASFGMTQINQLTGIITAVGNVNSPTLSTSTNTFTVNINTSAFSPFAFPASALVPTTALFATVAPAGQSTTYTPSTMTYTGYNFGYAPFHNGLFLPAMYLPFGANSPAGVAGDQIVWQAYKMENNGAGL